MKLLVNKEKNIIIQYKKRFSVEYRLILVDNISIEEKAANNVAFVDITKATEFISIFKNIDEKNLQTYLIENMLLFDIDNLDCHYVINNIDDDFLKIIKINKLLNLCVINNNHVDYYFILDKIIGI